MSATQVLEAAAQLISSEAKWCQRTCAVDSEGRFVGALNSDAVKFDLFGSIQRATHNLGLPLSDFHEAYAILKAAIPADVKNRDIECYNDKVSYSVIIAMLGGSTPADDGIITDTGDNIVTNLGDFIILSMLDTIATDTGDDVNTSSGDLIEVSISNT